ncbi:TPA: DUF6392 family protein [Citrobacter freundii]
MTVNIEALIRSFGRSYDELISQGLITYKTPPTATSGEPDLNLEMAKEGLFLTFKRQGRIFQVITLAIQNGKAKNWVFPSELPFGLLPQMDVDWVHSHFSDPIYTQQPKVIMRRAFGRCEVYKLDVAGSDVAIQFDFDIAEHVDSVTFRPLSLVNALLSGTK